MNSRKGQDNQAEHVFLEKVIDLAKQHFRIAIIYSGNHEAPGAVTHRTYHPRHWKSYENVANDLRDSLLASGFRHVTTLADDLNLVHHLDRVDLAWLNTGGMQGRNAICHAASFLELAGVPYIGHNPLNYALLDHKLQFKRHLQALGLPTPDFTWWDPTLHLGRQQRFLKEFRSGLGKLPAPWVVKPVNGRGSRYIQTANCEKSLMQAIAEIYRRTLNGAIVEEFMDGREYCVAGGLRVLKRGQSLSVQDDPVVFGSLEKQVAPDALFSSLDNSPITQQRAWPLYAEQDGTTLKTLARLCSSVCQSLSLKYLIRLDVRANREGCIKILEANPKPDLKRPKDGEVSLVAMGLRSINLPYDDLLVSLLASGLYHTFKYRPAAASGLAEILNQHEPNLQRECVYTKV